MTTKKLFELLTLVRQVRPFYHQFIYKLRTKIIACIKDGTCDVISKKWGYRFKEQFPDTYPLNLDSEEVWITYDKCTELRFSILNGTLHCIVNVHEGCLSDGFPTTLRFNAELNLPDEFIHELEELILYELNIHAEQQYKLFLEAKKNEWMNEYKSKLLNA